jgi:hypothetical protein
MQYPNTVQSALLFDRPMTDLALIVQNFLKIEAAKSGAHFNVSEANPGFFYRLYGHHDLMITLEYIDGPANPAVFAQALESPIMRMLCPDMPERIARHRSHVLINVSHGVLPDMPEIAALMADLDMPVAGASLPQFVERLDTCAFLSQLANDVGNASVVHWTQSNQLLSAEVFETYAKASSPGPGMLHIHPLVFNGGVAEDGQQKAEILTFGARHFIGREVQVRASVIPWSACYETVLAFLRVATVENGYIIPDGDLFGPEDGSQSFRVHHLPANEGSVPTYELEPMMFREYGFQSESYVGKGPSFDDRSVPSEFLPNSQSERADILNDLRARREMVEGVGGHLQVRAKPAAPTNAPPPQRGFMGRKIFGRKST